MKGLFFLGLWTELWGRASLKYMLTPERPQLVETFIMELMEGAEESGGQVSKKTNKTADDIDSKAFMF